HGIVIGPRTVHVERQARLHLGLLATVLIGVKAWGYQLDTYDLLYSRRGVVFGAVYADIHAALPILQGLIVLCALPALAYLLLATYRQLQQIRTYYDFVDVDNDRYMINAEYRQVMLSPRELSYKNLPSRIWINEHFTYTHGYGVTLGPVNRISAEGLPEFFI